MDGIEKIIGRINAAAAEECAAIAQKSEEECELVRAEYAQKVQSAYESAIKSGEIEIGLEAERVIRNAKLNARKEVLYIKQEMIDAAFDAAKGKLLSMPREDYEAWLVKTACQASEGTGELIFSQRDLELGQAVVKKANEALLAKGKTAGLSLSTETRDIDFGFVLRDGKFEVNCTLSAVFEMNRQNIASKVINDLFA